MQYVWQHRLWPRTHLHTVDGRPIHVVDPGQLNRDAGPDFFNAKVVIDGNTWAGDVEIHVRASDWHRHGHDSDPAYDSVVLHVVDRNDTSIRRRNSPEVIPQLLMTCAHDFAQIYDSLTSCSSHTLPCADTIRQMAGIHLTNWLDSLAFERIYEKADRIEGLLNHFQGDWDSAAYVTLARNFGFGLNSEPFQRLALATPLPFIARHCDSLLSAEALLFGQSGLLQSAKTMDEYTQQLVREHAFMSKKFSLRPLESPGWKMMRMRPANFPHRRIATLAALLHHTTRLASQLIEINSLDQVRTLFDFPLTGYWENHYSFGAPSSSAARGIGTTLMQSIVINTVVPLQVARAQLYADDRLLQQAIDLLQSLPGEHNSITDMFSAVGVNAKDAMRSQSLIQLRRAYCEPRKCLYCRIGHRMLAQKTPANHSSML